MTLHPIRTLDHVIDEYRDHLRTEFRAKDPLLREALEKELDRPLFLAQEPFYQAHRPFCTGKAWRELGLDPKLAAVMEERTQDPFAYSHQSDAIVELLSPVARPVVITTGTGSGKTEAFLLPVIQNAIEDSLRYHRPGLTAILVYPMNALANDQLQRIQDYLDKSKFSGVVSVAKYDRSTSQEERQRLREKPPHIVLTNYMMLEYLLVRPADREGIFANHRCRFLVLDEVHTYRGSLGGHIALLVRRFRSHLHGARHDWETSVSDAERHFRYPELIPVGTSATIKSQTSEERSNENPRQQRDQAVQEFFSKLTGFPADSIRVFGEEIAHLTIPVDATYAPKPVSPEPVNPEDPENVRRVLCQLAGLAEDLSLAEAARRCRWLWDLNRWLIEAPRSVSQLTQRVVEEVPERRDADPETVRVEVEAALVAGAALPEGIPGGIRIRAHRFIRGGWRFHRCLNPQCNRLHPKGEESCACGYPTAPLYLCRNCGADYLRFVGDPEEGPLRPSAILDEKMEWVLYDFQRFESDFRGDEETGEDGEDVPPQRPNRRRRDQPKEMKGREILRGSFDPRTCQFSPNESDYPQKVILAPARNRCLCCGGSAGSRNVITPVSLGTSAALKVITEGTLEALRAANQDRPGYDGKDRLLIFSDSRQDAAHQARFIHFASRYDRMRRYLYRLLKEKGTLTIQRSVELLANEGVQHRDNPHLPGGDVTWLPAETQERIRAWEEAPLLDEIAVNAGYRATLFNLGLVGVRYDRLDEYIEAKGEDLSERLGIPLKALEYICACLLDEMRTRSALSRPLLCAHPAYTAFPEALRSAEWERRIPQPQGYAASVQGKPLLHVGKEEIPAGINVQNFWRKPGAGGRSPRAGELVCRLVESFGGLPPNEESMLALLDFLQAGYFITAPELCGHRDKRQLLQVNAETVQLVLLDDDARCQCNVCGRPMPFVNPGSPCPLCHGQAKKWTEAQVINSRHVRRIRSGTIVTLHAREHTAQVTQEERSLIEDTFKGKPQESPVNVLACSPTLELGIDVGGLDAVALRNIPPRPDNYAQRGGRSGRRTRVGLVIGYAPNRPHDQYFYDRPEEMIAGEIPPPNLALGNRDILLRHLHAIVFSLAEPGLSGRMVDYVDQKGAIQKEKLQELLNALQGQSDVAVQMATRAFGADVLSDAGLSEADLHNNLQELPAKVWRVIERTAKQVIELRTAVNMFSEDLKGGDAAKHAAAMIARLLGTPSDNSRSGNEADDRSAGYPMRRFAEFGILPGYEFPTEPASLRLLGDAHEEEPVTVGRRFGISQFEPNAQVFARNKRWKVIGLDTASPWNPTTGGPTWSYRLCRNCGLRYDAQSPRCPRCGDDRPGQPLPAVEYGGFIARREERPVSDEEERYAEPNRIGVFPQWDGDIVGRWRTAAGYSLRLSRNEEVRWLNEGERPKDDASVRLHEGAEGYFICDKCGALVKPAEEENKPKGGRRQARTSSAVDPYGHRKNCSEAGKPGKPVAIVASGKTEVLRLLVPIPPGSSPAGVQTWAVSLGYALRIGMRRFFMLDGPEIEFEFEGPWNTRTSEQEIPCVALAFIDPSLGGTGFLPRVADEFHQIARTAMDHLDHEGCETACYRCLKSYTNQRHHEILNWTLAIPFLEALSSDSPIKLPLKVGDIEDPAPWLEAYALGLGSPLELKFWRLFEKHGFTPQKQVPVAPAEGMKPISVADFAVPEKRLAIYVDGASVHIGSVLRRDRFIRNRLRNGNPPWKVVELRAPDLSLGKGLIDKILQ